MYLNNHVGSGILLLFFYLKLVIQVCCILDSSPCQWMSLCSQLGAVVCVDCLLLRQAAGRQPRWDLNLLLSVLGCLTVSQVQHLQ